MAALLSIDPVGLGGAHVRAPHGPGRDALLATLAALRPDAPFRRMPAHVDDERLLGGLDLATSLATGRPILSRGLLGEADGGWLCVAMAERLGTDTAARIAAAMDRGEVHVARDGFDARLPARFGLILLDEGGDAEETPPAALLDRCALTLTEADLRGGEDVRALGLDAARVAEARARLTAAEAVDDAIVSAICETAARLGVPSPRPALWTLRAARALAALDGRERVANGDAALAARLILAPRALVAPEEWLEPETAPSEPDPGDRDDGPETESAAPPPEAPQDAPEPASSPDAEPARGEAPPAEILLDAVKAALPAGALAALLATGMTRGRGSASASRIGADKTRAAARGRPVGTRRGAPGRGRRLDLLATLRAAAPWQAIRRADHARLRPEAAPPAPGRILVSRDDFRVKRFKQRRQSTTIFAVDASGSSAWARMAEAKGAVELLLAKAYVARARVALVAFRKVAADVVLPPTRSLTRARRLLADMAGGGGTPLASGLEAALRLALAERAKGHAPRIVLLTDGRANVARDGATGRAQADADALAVAKQVRAAGLPALHIDTSTHPRPGADALAKAMGAPHVPLPRAPAQAVATLVRAGA
jgi:magnesium chelatase subunit D